MPNAKTVYIVDAEPATRDALCRLLAEVGHKVVSFDSAQAFLTGARLDRPACVLLDIRLPEPNGLAIQERMRSAAPETPVIFLTAHGDVATCAKAMKAGAIDYLTKPARKDDLLAAIALAHANSAARHGARIRRSLARERFAQLTAREQQVFALVLADNRNKEIANALGSQEATVKVHRSRLMRKLALRSLTELLHFARELEPHPDADGERAGLPRNSADPSGAMALPSRMNTRSPGAGSGSLATGPTTRHLMENPGSVREGAVSTT